MDSSQPGILSFRHLQFHLGHKVLRSWRWTQGKRNNFPIKGEITAFNAHLPRGAQHPLGPQGKLSKDQYGKEEL